ncbi:MAG: hypothetical protein PHV02_00215 [Rhodocyclaceae bacterium]|nr:hypothetical protein [Rhodocyclaceae bacterium]
MQHVTFDVPFRNALSESGSELLRAEYDDEYTNIWDGDRVHCCRSSGSLLTTGATYDHALIEREVNGYWQAHAIRISFSPADAAVGHSLFLKNDVQLSVKVAEFVLKDVLNSAKLKAEKYIEYFDLEAMQLIDATAAFFVKCRSEEDAILAEAKLFLTMKRRDPERKIALDPIKSFCVEHDGSCVNFYAMSDPDALIESANFPGIRWVCIPEQMKYDADRFVKFEANLTRNWLIQNKYQNPNAWDSSAYDAVQSWLCGALWDQESLPPKSIKKMLNFTTNFDIPLQWERYYFGPKAAVTFLPELARVIEPKL